MNTTIKAIALTTVLLGSSMVCACEMNNGDSPFTISFALPQGGNDIVKLILYNKIFRENFIDTYMGEWGMANHESFGMAHQDLRRLEDCRLCGPELARLNSALNNIIQNRKTQRSQTQPRNRRPFHRKRK